MNLLIAYGTTEGHTRKVCGFIADRVRNAGYGADLVDLSRTPGTANPDIHDRFIVAASVHQKLHQETVGGFIIANRAALAQKPSMFLSVSLAAAFEERIAEAQGYVDDFLSYLEWSPDSTLLVAGALKYDEYDFFKSQIIEHIVLSGREIDRDKTDHDFTDWPTLGEAIDTFVA